MERFGFQPTPSPVHGFQTSHLLRSLVVQVTVHPSLQAHTLHATEGFDVAHCTQIPVTHAKTILKRPRKERQCKVTADGGQTTPTPPRSSRGKKLTSAGSGFADQALQTPMPETDAPNELGPPPPDSTPAPGRGESCVSQPPIWSFSNLRNNFFGVSKLA